MTLARQSAVCAVEPGCWCRSRASLLWNLVAGAAAGGSLRDVYRSIGAGV